MRAAACFFLLAVPVLAQDFVATTLSRRIPTNESVVTPAKAGFDELFIVERIKASRTRFDMSVEGMVSLKGAGVTEELIGAMALQDRRRMVRCQPGPLRFAKAPQRTARPAGCSKYCEDSKYQ